ncbi:MAG: DUF3108 domain-containing protein [Burkholderiaceae bacterium]
MRRTQWLALVALVTAVHAWLIGPLRQPLGHSPERAPTVQLVTLPPAESVRPEAQVQAPAQADAPAELASPGPGPARPARPAPAPPPLLAAPEPPAVAPPPVATDRPVDWLAGPLAPEAVSGSELDLERAAAAATAASSPGAPVPGLVPGAGHDDGGSPLPVYATLLPTQPFRLDYRIERGDEAGIGQLSLDFEKNGDYRARFAGSMGDKPLQDWVSTGRFDRAGVAPRRMVERQRMVELRALNFQRDQGVISQSSSVRAWALAEGAQDRVSLLLQLMAVAQAQPEGLSAGQRIRLQVGFVRGEPGEWVFDVVGREKLEPNGTPIDTVHLVREPERPYDLRMDVWLARQAGHLPVGLRLAQVPGRGDPVAYWLAGPLPALAFAPPASAALNSPLPGQP